MTSIILFGVGSGIVADYAETCARLKWTIAAAVQNREGRVFFSDQKIIVKPDAIDPSLAGLSCFCPLFTPQNRFIACREALSVGLQCRISLVDPTSVIASSTRIGAGTYINAGCVIGGEANVGRHVLINRAASVGHHGRIADFVSIGPGSTIAGEVEIGTGATIGAGAVVLPKVRVGKFATIGAGAVVARDVPDSVLVAGNPATVVRGNLPEFDLREID
ncbi:MAG: acetyltransferase [Pseudorhodoplanes sp.]